MKVLSFISLLMLLTFACSNTSNSKSTTTNSNTVATADGKAIFKTYCVLCHGSDGKQQLNGSKDLTVSTLTEAETLQVITKGRNAMAAYESTLSEDELKAVAAYVMNFRK